MRIRKKKGNTIGERLEEKQTMARVQHVERKSKIMQQRVYNFHCKFHQFSELLRYTRRLIVHSVFRCVTPQNCPLKSTDYGSNSLSRQNDPSKANFQHISIAFGNWDSIQKRITHFLLAYIVTEVEFKDWRQKSLSLPS